MPLCLCSLASRKTWSVIASDVTKRSLSVAEDQPQAASTINTLFIRLALSEDDLVLGSEDTDLSQTGTRKITLGKGKILAQSGAEELTVQTSQGDVKLPPNSVVAIQSDGKNNVRVSSLGGDGTIGAIINKSRRRVFNFPPAKSFCLPPIWPMRSFFRPTECLKEKWSRAGFSSMTTLVLLRHA